MKLFLWRLVCIAMWLSHSINFGMRKSTFSAFPSVSSSGSASNDSSNRLRLLRKQSVGSKCSPPSLGLRKAFARRSYDELLEHARGLLIEESAEYRRLVELKKNGLKYLDVHTEKGQELLWEAVKRDNGKFVELMLDGTVLVPTEKNPLDVLNEEGQTPLMYASAHNYQFVVLILLQVGATVDVRSTEGKTALWYAAENDYKVPVRFLLQYKADAKVSVRGQLLLTHLVKMQNKEILEELLQYGNVVLDEENKEQKAVIDHAVCAYYGCSIEEEELPTTPTKERRKTSENILRMLTRYIKQQENEGLSDD